MCVLKDNMKLVKNGQQELVIRKAALKVTGLYISYVAVSRERATDARARYDEQGECVRCSTYIPPRSSIMTGLSGSSKD